MVYHILALIIGFIIDCIMGDPYDLPHPIRIIGSSISWLEKRLLTNELSAKRKRLNGTITVLVVCIGSMLISGILLWIGYAINSYIGMLLEAIMTYQIIAARCLKDESEKVLFSLENESLEKSRVAVSMIVGRDTQFLSKEGVIKAAVETVAENTSDGVIAPLFYTAIAGPVLGFAYKAINTCDSMIGYKNDKYIDFGRSAAMIDDVVNFIPSRLSAIYMIIACFLFRKRYDTKNAIKIFKRDRYKHASPNSAQTESVCAGALDIQLAGDAYYFGTLHKKSTIGDSLRDIEVIDIHRINHLMYVTTVLFLASCVCIKICVVLFS